ncbi:MAG: ParB/RepB/Spo0J family partition protein [Planctomycetaceae bacterium]
MKYHPAACIFPLMADEDFDNLVEDIKTNGQHLPIILHKDGRILDGRNRLTACTIAGVEPCYETWEGDDGSEIQYVLSLNLHRRHLTSSQLACTAVKADEAVAKLREEAAKRHREGSGTRSNPGEAPQLIGERGTDKKHDGETDHKLAEMTGTNRQYVADARKLQEEAPEVFEQVQSGEKTIPEANRELKKQQPAKKKTLPKYPLSDGFCNLLKDIVATLTLVREDHDTITALMSHKKFDPSERAFVRTIITSFRSTFSEWAEEIESNGDGSN